MFGHVDLLQCPICLEIAAEPRETLCCHQILCHDHIALLKGCPSCRTRPLRVQNNVLAERLVGVLPVECPFGCKENVIRSNLSDHQRVCQNRPFSCPFSGCSASSSTSAPLEFQGASAFKNHLMEVHDEMILAKLHLIAKETKAFPSASDNNNTAHKNVDDQTTYSDHIGTRFSSHGIAARLGATGKYFCGQLLPSFCCANCDGRCGPTNGCNCPSCMSLDLNARRLPLGYLVNREGFASRKLNSFAHFYCGRRVMESHAYFDGYCGPTNGPNCHSCALLDQQEQSLYANLL